MGRGFLLAIFLSLSRPEWGVHTLVSIKLSGTIPTYEDTQNTQHTESKDEDHGPGVGRQDADSPGNIAR